VVTPILWNGAERVTILIMGIDSRDWSQGEDIPRTDTMILLTIDPTTKKAGILSIPRDMWVAIPGFGEHKINTAYRWGELYEFPGGGSGLAMRTVRNVIGVPVQYFVLVDFNAFVALIDAMGGLDMHIREEILIDPVGPGNTRLLEPGVQTLSGAEVLAYARNRSTEYDDFDRSKRQQELILAIRSQVLTFNMLPALMAEAPALFARLSSGIRTNLTLDEMIGLAWLAAGVPEENIERSVFDMHKDFNYSTAETAEGVLDILLLKPERMRLLREEMFPTR
jgi:LCP family protein required for cell wall assembly